MVIQIKLSLAHMPQKSCRLDKTEEQSRNNTSIKIVPNLALALTILYNIFYFGEVARNNSVQPLPPLFLLPPKFVRKNYPREYLVPA